MRNRKIVLGLALVLVILVATSCQYLLVGEIVENTPENNFESLWNEFDMMYGLFVAKGIDWDALYSIYRPMVRADTTDEELFGVLTTMLDELNDNHISMYSNNINYTSYSSGIYDDLGPNSLLNLDLIRNGYLSNLQDCTGPGGRFFYGRLDDNLGYIYLEDFEKGMEYLEETMDAILDFMADLDGIVFDVRNNYGGADNEGRYIASRFATETRLYMTSKHRNGPNHDDFTPETLWYVEPAGDSQYVNPVVLLTDRWSISAAETFAFAMRQNDNVTHVGDITSGAFSDSVARELPNGWYYGLSIGDYRDASGTSYEGIGIAPDILVKNTEEEVAGGQDRALERCMEFLATP
jgi:peptidase S41-like protein/tricorn protease-like protein